MKRKSKIVRTVYYLFALSVFIFGIIFYKSAFSYMLFALIFSFLFNPVITAIERLGIKRTWAVLIFFVVFFLNVYLIGSLLLPVLIRQIISFGDSLWVFINQQDLNLYQIPYWENIEIMMANIKDVLPFVDFDGMRNTIVEYLNSFIERIPSFIGALAGNVFRIITYLISVPIISFFILKDQVLLKKKFYALIPNKYFEISILLIDKIRDSVGTYIRAIFTEMVILATLTSIVLSILGIKFAVLIGILAGVLNIIPYLGPFTGFILAGLTVILTGGSTQQLLVTLLCMWLINTLDNSVIYPLVMGKNTNINPAIVILSVLAGGLTFGLIGMLLAVPTVFLLSTILSLLYRNLKQFEII